jgi:hypothetical protein
MKYSRIKSLEEETQENIMKGEMNFGINDDDADKEDEQTYDYNEKTDNQIKYMLDSYQQEYLFSDIEEINEEH